MFTGIITALGTLREVQPIGQGHDMRLVIGVAPEFLAGAALGCSIACSGICLTAVELNADSFAVDASAETLARTTMGQWRTGGRVNLERSLKLGDELGGHLVSGHVDGVGRVLSATPENASVRWRFGVPRDIAKYIAVKGSVAIDGVSLTVNEVDAEGFGVNIIPHTAAVTSFGTLQPGDAVNIEIDTLARYVARLMEFRA
ncbi:riboflavin synthase [Roseococcus sp. SDR]|uniref:riboflavin synthase n=1 Tax=Roseococcus sp. SDR TaxID=2835532 RepID=UPI001BCE11EC|nr:riboflavin synthase [Roseococcus sp. SDR]MBS7790185.1 riboflavin synthase [Roseococcus sp. SDR]MBV1845499.1 riboflavin synthase [Roseococcus sp. SDR]